MSRFRESCAFVTVALAALLAAAGCAGGRAHPAANDIQTRLAGQPPAGVDRAVWNDVRAFYSHRELAPAWIGESSPSKKAKDAWRLISLAGEHGLSAADYDEAQIARRLAELGDADTADKNQRLKNLAELEIRVSTALLALGRDVALGRTTPASIDRRWKPRRTAPDFAASLTQAIDDRLAGWLDAIRPAHPEYAALQRALVGLKGVKQRGGWPKVSAGVFKRDVSHQSVIALRQRLAATGELAANRRSRSRKPSTTFDSQVEAAVRAFQEHHALKATGIVDAATLSAMNVTVDERLRQIALNLDRWRWMPDDFGERHLIVNIPYFHVVAREHGKTVSDIRVVVGKPGNETPVFSSEMHSVVFSPYWNIPDTIVTGETAPAVARDANYLARNNIEILRVSNGGAERVDPSTIDWDKPEAVEQLAFRQRPGARNALGHVKFLFTNPYNVYLHDTPADDLFSRRGRAFSHGCVRVEEPTALAKYVLRDQTDWTEPRIHTAMNAGVEKLVKLREPIPVHIVYFTAWVDDAGGIHFQPDVYGYDKRQGN
ncbi:MAG TPA: L,D-transpeptidase family protein [Vicinamibacterales bacterium]|nr:L,D-transpeptidase family protein [Vicinamibacterales bacterium]